MKGHDGASPPLPDVGPMRYLLDVFLGWGKGNANGMAFTAFTPADIVNICDLEGLTKNEGRLLRKASMAYAHMLHHAKDPFILPPWDGS